MSVGYADPHGHVIPMHAEIWYDEKKGSKTGATKTSKKSASKKTSKKSSKKAPAKKK